MPKTIILDAFRYITGEAWRALVAVEMGMKNHEVVPPELAQKISHCKRSISGFIKLIKDQLVPNKLVAFERVGKKCISGYRLTNLGYDYLALHQFFNSGQLNDLKYMIGAGKESDVYLGVAGDNCGASTTDNNIPVVQVDTPVIVKFHRLGRTSFRKVKEKRDYHQHRTTCSWLYLDRLASQREFVMMKALASQSIPVPQPLAHNRNAVVMSYVTDSVLLSRILPGVLKAADEVLSRLLYTQAKHILHTIASIGLIHGDFNEFNLMVVGLNDLDMDLLTPDSATSSVQLVLIDFPQMISRGHDSADRIYRRDAQAIISFFGRYFDIEDDQLPLSLDEIKRVADLDVEVKAPGYPSKQCNKRKHPTDLATDLMLNAVARNRNDSSDSETDSEVDDEASGSDVSTDSSLSQLDEEAGSIDNEHATPSITESNLSNKMHSIELEDATTSGGVIAMEEIRQRNRRERRKQEQVNFQHKVKRNARAKLKRQGRADMKTELVYFG